MRYHERMQINCHTITDNSKQTATIPQRESNISEKVKILNILNTLYTPHAYKKERSPAQPHYAEKRTFSPTPRTMANKFQYRMRLGEQSPCHEKQL